METVTFILSLIILFASLYYCFFRKTIPSKLKQNEKVSSYPLPPGSKGWPIIGETLDYLRTAKNGVPEKFLNDRRNKYSQQAGDSCKAFTTSLFGEPMAMLCSAAGNKFLYSNQNKLVKMWWPANFEKLLPNFQEKEENFSAETIHSRFEVAPFLKPGALQNYVEIIGKITKHHSVTYWSPSLSSPSSKEKQVVKVYSLVKKFTFTLSCKIFLNLEDPQLIDKMEKYMRLITVGIGSMPLNLPGTNFRRGIIAAKQMHKELESLVEQRKLDLMNQSKIDRAQSILHPPEDLLSILLMATINGEERMASNIAGKLFAPLIGSYDTFVSTICSIIIFLSQLPQVYDEVFKEQMEIADSKVAGESLNWEDIQKMKYTWNVACETLRLQPPANGSFREAITDFIYEGHLIPSGMKLHWNVFATHKNPEYFPDPEKFDPSRFEGQGPPPYSYVPFGGGPRMCPGKEYARLVLLVFMHYLITGFKWEKVFADEKMVMNPLSAPTQGLPLWVYRL